MLQDPRLPRQLTQLSFSRYDGLINGQILISDYQCCDILPAT